MSNLLANYMDNFFDDLTMSPHYLSRKTTSLPSLNITEFDKNYEITLMVPGIKEDDIKLEIIDNTLKISYEHNKENRQNNDGKIIREEYSHYSFSRSVLLPNNVDKDSINAHTKKGILSIILEKLPETQPKKIEIMKKD